MKTLKEIKKELKLNTADIRKVDIFKCVEHPEYGRNSNKDLASFKGMADYIKTDFDGKLFQMPTVMDISKEVGEERYEVLDGNNRIQAIKDICLAEKESSFKLQVRVLPLQDVIERAELFVRLNDKAKPVSPRQKFKAYVVAKREKWLELVDTVRQFDLSIQALDGLGTGLPTFKGVTALLNAKGLRYSPKLNEWEYFEDKDVLPEVLSLITHPYQKGWNLDHRNKALEDVVMRGGTGFMVTAKEEHYRVDEDDMWDKLSKISPYALVDDLQENRAMKINQKHTGIKLGLEKENGLTRYFIRLCNNVDRGNERLRKSYKLRA